MGVEPEPLDCLPGPLLLVLRRACGVRLDLSRADVEEEVAVESVVVDIGLEHGGVEALALRILANVAGQKEVLPPIGVARKPRFGSEMVDCLAGKRTQGETVAIRAVVGRHPLELRQEMLIDRLAFKGLPLESMARARGSLLLVLLSPGVLPFSQDRGDLGAARVNHGSLPSFFATW